MAAPKPSALDSSQCIQGAYDEANGRLRVEGQATIVNGALEVYIDSSFDNIAIKNPTSGNVLAINSDGSINVSLTTAPIAATPRNNFAEITSVASGVLSTILTYTVPTGKSFYLNRVEVSGTNIGEYSVQFNSIVNAKKRTYFSNLNEMFDFTMGGNTDGFQLVGGTIITITTIHNRPSLGVFDARLQGFEV